MFGVLKLWGPAANACGAQYTLSAGDAICLFSVDVQDNIIAGSNSKLSVVDEVCSRCHLFMLSKEEWWEKETKCNYNPRRALGSKWDHLVPNVLYVNVEPLPAQGSGRGILSDLGYSVLMTEACKKLLMLISCPVKFWMFSASVPCTSEFCIGLVLGASIHHNQRVVKLLSTSCLQSCSDHFHLFLPSVTLANEGSLMSAALYHYGPLAITVNAVSWQDYESRSLSLDSATLLAFEPACVWA